MLAQLFLHNMSIYVCLTIIGEQYLGGIFNVVVICFHSICAGRFYSMQDCGVFTFANMTEAFYRSVVISCFNTGFLCLHMRLSDVFFAWIDQLCSKIYILNVFFIYFQFHQEIQFNHSPRELQNLVKTFLHIKE